MIDTYTYSFPADVYRWDGNVLTNLITESQKESVRQMFALFQNYFGVQFQEVVPVRDTRSAGRHFHHSRRSAGVRCAGRSGRRRGVATVGPGTVRHQQRRSTPTTTGSSAADSGTWRCTSILHNLGLTLQPTTCRRDYRDGRDDDASTPSSSEPVYPGDVDIIHGQLLHRPASIDIDLYQFTVDRQGTLSAETIAERLAAEPTPPEPAGHRD